MGLSSTGGSLLASTAANKVVGWALNEAEARGHRWTTLMASLGALTGAAIGSLAGPVGLVAAGTACALAGAILGAWMAGEELPALEVVVALVAGMMAVCLLILILLPAARVRFGNK